MLDGESWTDSRSGPYANPSPISDVIDRAIESGTGAANEGRVYEEQILRDPPIGYAFYHLWALTAVALMAEVQLDRDVWSWTGSDGAGLEDAYTRYADFLLGNRASPRPSQEGDLTVHAWMYEAAYRRWARPFFQQARDASGPTYLRQTLGPPTLLLPGWQFAPNQDPSAPVLLPE